MRRWPPGANRQPLQCPEMRKRDLYILAAILAALTIAVLGALLWRRSRPPQAARLLPAADTFIFADLRPLRAVNALRNLPAVERDPDYDEFVRATGIQFERDLDQVALAAHRPPADAGPNAETRYSEILTGRFDGDRLAAYLRKLSKATESYRNFEVYAIPLPGRTLRVAILNASMVAASNTEGSYVIHQVLDRYSGNSLAQQAPELLTRYYRRVPLTAIAWGVSQLTPPGAASRNVTLPGGYDLSLPPDTVLVASVQYQSGVRLQGQLFSANLADAQRVSDQLSSLLALFRTVETGAQPAKPDPDVDALFNSLNVSRADSSTLISATIPVELLKKIFSEEKP